MKYIKDYENKIKIVINENFSNFKIDKITDSKKKTYKIERDTKGFFNTSLEHDYALNGAKSVEIIVDYDEGTSIKIIFSDGYISKKLSYHQTLMIEKISNNGLSIDTYSLEEI